MPARPFRYLGTITFNGNTTPDRKLQKIDVFPSFLSSYLDFKRSTYTLDYSIEYHKVGNDDDFEAPHIHFILYADRQLPGYRYKAILNALCDKYGRSQFYIATKLKAVQYANYIQKDNVRLKDLTGQDHFFTLELQDPKVSYMYGNEDSDTEFLNDELD